MSLVTFDLDGVIADTEHAVRKAYFIAGVEMPVHAWGLPAEEWLTGMVHPTRFNEVHDRKNEVYPDVLEKDGRELAGVMVLKHLREDGEDVAIVTHASAKAAAAVMGWLKLLDVDVFPTKDKHAQLVELGADVHVDDQEVRTTVPVVPFVNDEEELYGKIREVLSSTQSFSQPATALD